MYLIDTNVISAGARAKTSPGTGPVGWMDLVTCMDDASDALFLSMVTVAEIEDGIAKARREGATRKAADLTGWLEALVHLYGNRILAIDLAVSRTAGKLSNTARGCGHAPGFADILIAATALHHELVILTRNVRHFEPLGVPVLNLFDELPPLRRFAGAGGKYEERQC
jgi:predicted nucleic acid-binding protein